jgi:hypothetical protein
MAVAHSRGKQPESQDSGSNRSDVEFTASLENSVPLEAPRIRYVSETRVRTAPVDAASVSPLESPVVEPAKPIPPIETHPPLNSMETPALPTPPPITPLQKAKLDERTIPLLEERLVVDRQRRKVGEVIVRKEIEVQMVQVPVRREKLIVEQVLEPSDSQSMGTREPQYKSLVELDLGTELGGNRDSFESVNGQINGNGQIHEYGDGKILPGPILSGEFNSARAAIQFIEAIAENSDQQQIQVSFVVQDVTQQGGYQQLLDQYSVPENSRT